MDQTDRSWDDVCNMPLRTLLHLRVLRVARAKAQAGLTQAEENRRKRG